MALTTTEINSRRRERYRAKKFRSGKDETNDDNEKIQSDRDETLQIIKSDEANETKDEPKSVDIFENLYSHHYEQDSSFMEENPMKMKEKPPQPEPQTLSKHKRNKPIRPETYKLLEKIQTQHIQEEQEINNPKVNNKTVQKIIDNSNQNAELKDKILLNHKIKQYKLLFPDELKSYKVSPTASVSKLKAHLEEIEILISLDSVDTFIMESVFYSIKMIEGFSARTKNYNIEGLADMLKQNPDFIKLAKQLYLKYNTFENIPPEYQMMMIVATSTYVCLQKNKNKSQMEDLLNQPFEGEI